MSDSSVVSRIVHQSLMHQPSIMPKGPWWEYLEANFHARPEPFDLEPGDAWRVNATAAMDVVSRTLVSTLLAATVIPGGFRPGRMKSDFDSRNLYQEFAESKNPADFFAQPPRDVPIRKRRPDTPHFKPEDGGTCNDLVFSSPFEPFNPALRNAYCRHKMNRQAIARYWRHGDKPRPTVVAIHGFAADPYWVNERFFALPWIYHKLGCDVLLYVLPFHGARKGSEFLFSGQGFLGNGIAWVNEGFRQAVHDFRVFMNYLEDETGATKVGVTGVSLGGLTSSMLASVEPRLQFAIPNVPVVSIADLMMEWEPIGAIARLAMRISNKRLQEVRHLLALSCPLTYKPALPKERLMIIGGVGDRLAPPKHSRLLWDHWGRPRIHWFPGNHTIHLDKGAYLREMARFMSDIGFLES